MRYLTASVSLVIIFVAALYIFIYYNQKNQFLGTPIPANHQFNFSVPYSEINLKSDDLGTINVIKFTVPNSRGIVIFLHGGGGNVSIAEQVAQPILQAGFDFITFDYPGYGKTTVTPNPQSFYSSANEVYHYVKQHYADSNIVIYGRSLGCAIAASLAAENHPRKVILCSPVYERGGLVSQLPAVLQPVYRFVFPAAIQYQFKTHQYIRAIKSPATIFCGDKENDCSDSQKLMSKTGSNAQLISIPGVGHSDIVTDSVYLAKLVEAL